MIPRFYNLGPTGINTQEAPKVDGLVCGLFWVMEWSRVLQTKKMTCAPSKDSD